MLVAPADIERYLSGIAGAPAGGEAMRRLARDHRAFVRRLARERTLLDRRFFVVVPAERERGSRAAPAWPGLPWRSGRAPAPQRRDPDRVRRTLSLRCGEVTRGLGSVGVETRRLGGEELRALWRETLAPGAGRHAAPAPSPRRHRSGRGGGRPPVRSRLRAPGPRAGGPDGASALRFGAGERTAADLGGALRHRGAARSPAHRRRALARAVARRLPAPRGTGLARADHRLRRAARSEPAPRAARLRGGDLGPQPAPGRAPVLAALGRPGRPHRPGRARGRLRGRRKAPRRAGARRRARLLRRPLPEAPGELPGGARRRHRAHPGGRSRG